MWTLIHSKLEEWWEVTNNIYRTLYDGVLYRFTGWLGYSNDKVKTLCSEYLANGFTAFKVKVGQNLEDDRRRCAMVREVIGWDNKLVHTIISLCNFP
jgi:L-alanine-DL-glutamate epimerase-like enolase superfamily enzyme